MPDSTTTAPLSVLAPEFNNTAQPPRVESYSPDKQCLPRPTQVVVLSVLDPTGLTSLLIEAGLGYALKYGGELPMSREAENEADGTKF